MTPASTDALIVVDPQNDFLPGGTLAVAEGERIFAPVNAVMPSFEHVYATRDWHPENHRYFSKFGGPWPLHCLQNTRGAEFSQHLQTQLIDEVVSKGVDPETDGYSGFAGTDLAARLREQGVRRVFVCGLATDYCVKATAIEAIKNGFEALVLTDAIAAVNVKPEDEAAALDAMRASGVELITTSQIRRTR
ncbi:MAG: nicotinamidase [Candidatus Eremiobacteraeota bacterium]|nr:nicotinamidase [Candidatus Eremiobacteraeota bacterium]